MSSFEAMGSKIGVNTSCPLCQGTSLKELKDLEEKIYLYCLTCDLIFLSAPFLPSREEEEERYLLHQNTLTNQGYVKMLRDFIKKTILPFREGRVKALDFGCGKEAVLKVLLEEEGFSVDVYDPLFFPTLKGEKYHLITITEVLEHIPGVKEVFKQLEQLLLPGALLAVMTHFHRGKEEFLNWWYRKDFTHVSFYSYKSFSYLARNFSYSILYTDSKKTILMKRS